MISFLMPNGEEVNQQINLREDPLTGDISIIAPGLLMKRDLFRKDTNWELIDEIYEESSKTCPFCFPRMESSIPKFPKSWNLKTGWKHGEAAVFPNLFPQWENHAVVRLTEKHHLRFDQISSTQLENGFLCSMDYLKHIYSSSSSNKTKFSSINWNYLHPAGATLPHAHFQVLCSEEPTNAYRTIRAKSKEYRQEKKSNFWTDLIKVEQSLNQRFLGTTGNISWFCPFSPSANHEINGILTSVDLLDFKKSDLKLLSKFLIKILNKYQQLDYSSFNISLMGELSKEASPYINAFFKIIPRQNVYKNYRNDVNFLGRIHQTHFISTSPEKTKKVFFDIFNQE